MFKITRQAHYKAVKALEKEGLSLDWVKEKRKVNKSEGGRKLFCRFNNELKGYSTEPLIHHSDRGVQYCCKEYTGLLIKKRITISMTEENHCYENACAERVNGILKQEYGLDDTFKNEKQALKAVKEAILIYNSNRLHTSLGF